MLARLRRQPLKKKKHRFPVSFLCQVSCWKDGRIEATDCCQQHGKKQLCTDTEITESWLHLSILDSAIELTGYMAQDRTIDFGKSRGVGHINNSWCTNTVPVDRQCFTDLEYITVKCRPIHFLISYLVYHSL